MATDDDIAFYLQQLDAGDTAVRALTLRDLAQHPTGDPQVIAAIEQLLTSEEPCLVEVPPLYAEVRLLAAAALAAEIGPVPMRAVRPLTVAHLERLEQTSGISEAIGAADPIEKALARWRRLRASGVVREDDFVVARLADLSALAPR
jgi:phage FluMu protein gp41